MTSSEKKFFARGIIRPKRTPISHILVSAIAAGYFICPASSFAQANERTVRVEKATLGAGCFWCVEAVFERVPGVHSVVSGYAKGTKDESGDDEVKGVSTGPAEAVQITYDPDVVGFDKLLDIFWQAHDPTTLNRQGEDVGEKYRSAIWYAGIDQQAAAERSKREAQKYYRDSIVTEITPLKEFSEAKPYHQDYYEKNRSAPYCKFVIRPKLRKLGLEQ